MMSLIPIMPVSYLIRALDVASATETYSTPSTFCSEDSILCTQLEHVIPPIFSSTFPLLLLLSIRVAPNPRSSTKSTISSGVTSSGKSLTSAFPAINPTSIDTIPSSLPTLRSMLLTHDAQVIPVIEMKHLATLSSNCTDTCSDLTGCTFLECFSFFF